MSEEQKNNPLHGVKLKDILDFLVKELGWEKMSEFVDIKCFWNEPSIKSSLYFLRRHEWARKQVEDLYLEAKQNPNKFITLNNTKYKNK